jgi:uncharacterized membrane protein YhhN
MFTVKVLLRFFLILSIIYLTGILIPLPTIEIYLKPVLLLPLIAAAIIAPDFKNKIILIPALAFSWSGDTLLLFVSKNGVFFIYGLVAFLIAHLSYIALLRKELKRGVSTIKWSIQPLIFILIYLIILLIILIPHLGGLTIPVIIYAIVISVMLYMATLLSLEWPGPSAFYLLTGAVCFVVSDSLLALNKFYHPFPLSGFWIMVAYLYAQGALVWSFLKAN